MAMRNMIQKSIESKPDLYDEPKEREPRSRKRSDPITDADIVKGSFEGTTADRAELTDKLRKKIEKLIDQGYEKDIPSNWEEVLMVNNGDALFALSKVVFPGIFGTIMRTLFPANEGKTMKVTKNQLRKIIRESLRTTESLTTPEQFKRLQPGDNLSLNGKSIVVIGVSPMTGEVDYVDRGKATRKYFDYRMALAYEPGEMPEYDVVYLGPGEPPQNTRLPRR